MKRRHVSTKLRRVARVTGSTFALLLSTLDGSEIEAVADDPYEVLELALMARRFISSRILLSKNGRNGKHIFTVPKQAARGDPARAENRNC